MLRRVRAADRAAAAAVVLGAIAAYFPWYSYSTATAHITVNGFRASILGDLFFVAIALTAVFLLMRHGAVEDMVGGRITDSQALTLLAGAAIAAVFLQLVLDLVSRGRSLGIGLILAILSSAALGLAAWLQRSRATRRFTVGDAIGEGF